MDVFGDVCIAWKDVYKGKVDDLSNCVDWDSVFDKWVNGACTDWKKQDVMENQCELVDVIDPTSETGYRKVNQCKLVKVGEEDVCTKWDQVKTFKWVCKKYAQKDVWEKQCSKTESQKTGTTQQCQKTEKQDVFADVCNKYEQKEVGQKCTATDPNWTCPAANLVSDGVTPARYYRYEGPVPAKDDDLADPANYRMVEIDRAQNINFSVPLEPRSGALRERKDCAALTSCTRLEEMQNYANWFTYYRHRLFAAIAVTSQAAADLKGDLSAIRLGFGRINYFDQGPDPWNPYGARLDGSKFPEVDKDPGPKDPHPGAVVRGVRSFTDSQKNDDRQEFFDFLFLLNWVGSTPNREAIDSIGNYYLRSGEFGPWSDNPGKGGGRKGDQQASCRRSFALLATDGEWTAIPEIPNVPPAQPLIEKRNQDPVNAGNGKNTAALATTGPQIQGAGLYKNETYTYDPAAEPQFSNDNFGVTNTLTDVAMYWWDRDLRPDVPNSVQKRPNRTNDSFWQSITTYIVGYGLNASMNTPQVRQDIKDGKPINWPLVDTTPTLTTGGDRINDSFRAAMSTRGDFYSATDPDSMRASIKGVFRAIAEQAYSGTGLTATSAQLTVGSTLFRASFTTQKWSGKLEAFDAISMANAAENQQVEPAPLWLAGFPQWDQRKIYTSIASVGAGMTFDNFNNLAASQQAALGDQEVMDYLRGMQDGLENSKPIGFPLKTKGWRDRDVLLGTIVTSSPLYSKAPNFAYKFSPAAGGGGGYAQHVVDNAANRRGAVYVGANAGMFHAFDGNPDPNQGGGKELFAYVPRSVYPYLKELTKADYTHRFFVDGPVVEGEVFLNNKWKTVVMGSTGAGPAGVFALDVSAPEQFDASKVLWDITPAEESDLGKVMGTGYIGSVKWGVNGGKWVALVPNGYDSANSRAVLLVIDMETGQTIRKIDTCKKNSGVDFAANEQGGRCDPTARNGLANLSVVFDSNRNVVGAYAGDYQGNLWRFDLSSGDKDKWKIATEDPIDPSGNTPAPLFTAVNKLNEPQPITAAPRASTHPLGGTYVVFGTGKFFEYPDQTSTGVQSIYGLWVRSGDKAPITMASLLELGLSETTVNNVTTRTLTGTGGFSWKTKRGWFVDMVDASKTGVGERVVASPSIERGVMTMASFQPTVTTDPCEGTGVSFLYSIPMDASLGVKATKVNGVIGNIMSVETPPLIGVRTNTLSKAEGTNAMKNATQVRDSSGVFESTKEEIKCSKIFSQINVQTGFVAASCAPYAPIRTWRPIR